MTYRKFTVLLGALIASLFFSAAHAQSSAVVVATCGTPPTTYSAGQNRQVTQDTNGNLCSNASAGGGAVTQGTSPWVDNVSQFGGSNVVTGTGAGGSGIPRVTVSNDSAIIVTGNVASGAADSGNPVKMGCLYNSTLPTLTTGQRGDCLMTARGSIRTISGGFSGSPSDGVSQSNMLSIPVEQDTSFVTRPLLTGGFAYNSSTWDRIRGDTNGIVMQAGLSSTYWYYTSGTSPILSNTTTAVTIKAAAGASVRNYIDTCQIGSTTLGTSVPLAIRDGASGTVIWAMRTPTTGWTNPIIINFVPPLRSTANTLLEIVTTTADTSGTYDVNCSGHTGS